MFRPPEKGQEFARINQAIAYWRAFEYAAIKNNGFLFIRSVPRPLRHKVAGVQGWVEGTDGVWFSSSYYRLRARLPKIGIEIPPTLRRGFFADTSTATGTTTNSNNYYN